MYEITVHVPETISAVHAASETNPWMDCFVLVLPEDVKPTVQAVREADDKYWADDDSVIGYGDAVKEAMDKLNCRYQLLLCDYNEYTDEPTEFWENLSDWIRWSMPTYEVKV